MEYRFSELNRLGNRTQNQDSSLVVRNQHGLLLVVSDGMGGRPHGKEAAKLIVQKAETAYRHTRGEVRSPAAFFETVLRAAHQAIITLYEKHKMAHIPGATAVMALIERNRVWWAHVGDSRFYLVRQGKILHQTQDHSYIEYLYRQGKLNREQLKDHPQRNALTRCIGCTLSPSDIEIGCGERLQSGDRLLLCTDGLWNSLTPPKLIQLLQRHPITAASEALAEEAERASYPNTDNITLISLEFIRHSQTHTAPRSATQPSPMREPSPSPSADQSLQHAINHIQQVLEEYGDQLDYPPDKS
ncbi:serine/threonine-protein phosphatase [Ectothiorhodospiraceae bacterium BW-2]|nr:serine/threonine-protein phosphatase [Ectothiorhodospiraceae bacterium BW-2]